MRIVFMGSPAFALPSLRALVESGVGEVVAVYTPPDREAGRGRVPQPPPVKGLAQEYGLPVCQPRNFRSEEPVAKLRAWAPDVIIVAAYGQILPRSVLAVPTRGLLNVHASLLPRWRGAAPIAHAILAGDRETGVTIMEIVPALDAGPIVSQRPVTISDEDTAGSLSERLANVGAALLIETLPGWYAGEIVPQPQDDSLATYAPPLTKEDGLIDWTEPAIQIWRRVRAYNPWPVARAILPSGEPLSILQARPLDWPAGSPPGTVLPAPSGTIEGGFVITAGSGAILPLLVQRAGRRPLPAADFLRGQRGLLGSRLQTAAKSRDSAS
jgi:methionyl-tRNA formyltransferase